MNTVSITVRLASPTDLDTLSTIDDDASRLFADAGLDVIFPDEHEFALGERARWLSCLTSGVVLLACDDIQGPIGFAATRTLDDASYLQQLSVRRNFMRRGVGSTLLAGTEQTASRLGHSDLWLTTYRHLPWNLPFYERRSFEVVPAEKAGPDVAAEFQHELSLLPMPEQRVIMRKPLATSAT